MPDYFYPDSSQRLYPTSHTIALAISTSVPSANCTNDANERNWRGRAPDTWNMSREEQGIPNKLMSRLTLVSLMGRHYVPRCTGQRNVDIHGGCFHLSMEVSNVTCRQTRFLTAS